MVWRRLTSMRTALILLFLLAVAAVPGSLLPQRPLNPDNTRPTSPPTGRGAAFPRLGRMFDVFGSVWFAAIYLLLAVSLIGCLIPRIRVHARAVARKPLPAPRNLERLPESGRFETSESAASYTGTARSTLGRRWRIVERKRAFGAVTLSAEKGLQPRDRQPDLPHRVAGVADPDRDRRFYTYEGNRIVVQGADNGFCKHDLAVRLVEARPARVRGQGAARRRSASTRCRSSPRTTPRRASRRRFRADITYRQEPRLEAAEDGHRSESPAAARG